MGESGPRGSRHIEKHGDQLREKGHKQQHRHHKYIAINGSSVSIKGGADLGLLGGVGIEVHGEREHRARGTPQRDNGHAHREFRDQRHLPHVTAHGSRPRGKLVVSHLEPHPCQLSLPPPDRLHASALRVSTIPYMDAVLSL
eukprot:803432-Rhodomonas_salina.2